MPTSVLVNCSAGLSLSAPETAPASVTSRPSSIQVTPSAATTSVWKLPQGNRSSRAGISVSTIAGAVPDCEFVMKNAPTKGQLRAVQGKNALDAGRFEPEGRIQTPVLYARSEFIEP